jgi:multimeric flavodoxin WrbA
MRVVAFNGSARRDGNTAILVREVFKPLEAEGIATELIQLAGEHVHGCTACYQCGVNQDRRCALDDDCINSCIAKMAEADGVILASPTYVTDVTPEIKCLIDRASLVGRANGHMFKRKVGAAVVAVRRGGAIHAFDTLSHFFLIHQMVVPGSSYWNIAYGRNIGEVEQDAEGMQTMRDLGANMAWLLKKLSA